jgi:hypothetical protein
MFFLVPERPAAGWESQSAAGSGIRTIDAVVDGNAACQLELYEAAVVHLVKRQRG